MPTRTGFLHQLIPVVRDEAFSDEPVESREPSEANSFQQYLTHTLGASEHPIKRPVYVSASHLAFPSEEESSDRTIKLEIDAARSRLWSVARDVGLELNTRQGPAIERLVTIFFDDPNLLRRHAAGLLLRCLVRGTRTIPDASLAQLIAHEAQVKAPLLRATIHQ